MVDFGKARGFVEFFVKMPDAPASVDSSADVEGSSSPPPGAEVPPEIQAAAVADEQMMETLAAALQRANGSVWLVLSTMTDLADVVTDPAQRYKAALKVTKLTQADVETSLEVNLRLLDAEDAKAQERHQEQVRTQLAQIDTEADVLRRRVEDAKRKLAELEEQLANTLGQHGKVKGNLASIQATWIATVAQIRQRLEQVRGVGA